MSRVDDDRDDARALERLMQQRRAEETRRADKAVQDSQFSRLVTQAKDETTRAEEHVSARSAIEALLEERDATQKGDARLTGQRGAMKDADQRSAQARTGTKASDQKVAQGSRSEGQRTQASRLSSAMGDSDTASSRGRDQASTGKSAAGRASDAKAGKEALAARGKDANAADDAKAANAGDEKGDLKTDADKGGGGKQQGGGDKKGSEPPPSFRFNPALMAPVPVAQKNPAQGSDRLRRIATEIAQKIVERVRVGTNAAGASEFQIDLRSNVLSGLQVKVSAKHGRISAIFSGSDKDVLKMLQDHEEALKGALSSRGLVLEQFKVEAKI